MGEHEVSAGSARTKCEAKRPAAEPGIYVVLESTADCRRHPSSAAMRRASRPHSLPAFASPALKPHIQIMLLPKGPVLMKVYESAAIRNIAVVGHSHAGKTSLVSAML